MNIQSLAQTGTQGVQQQNQVLGAVGATGSLLFNTEQGATPRGSRPSLLSRIGNMLTSLNLSADRVSAQARAQRGTLDQTHDSGRHISSLLTDLAAAPNDVQAQYKAAQNLALLSKESQGDLKNLQGGLNTLDTCVHELAREKLLALRQGALLNDNVRKAVLSQVPLDLCDEAVGVLEQMAKVVNKRLAISLLFGPLWQIGMLQYRRSSDRVVLDEQLTVLSANVDLLDTYFQSLPWFQIDGALAELNPKRLDAAEEALLQLWGRREESERQRIVAFIALDLLRASVGRAVHAQIKHKLEPVQESLAVAVRMRHRSDAVSVLNDLNTVVGTALRVYGWLPEETAEGVRKMVKDGLDLIRDAQSDPNGPLTADSLSRLDDRSRESLRQASNLHSLGLELGIEAAKGAISGRFEDA